MKKSNSATILSLQDELVSIKKKQEIRERRYIKDTDLVEMREDKLNEFCENYVSSCQFHLSQEESALMFSVLKSSVKWMSEHCIDPLVLEKREAFLAEREKELSEKAIQLQLQITALENDEIQVLNENGEWNFEKWNE